MKETILKPTDKKLLSYLYHNSREPATKIAKFLKISREQVSYRIKKFESEAVIKGYIPIVSYSRLGYHLITLMFFKLSKPVCIQKFKEELKANKNRVITVETLSEYDLGALFVFKNEKERNDCLSEILQINKDKIFDFHLIEPHFLESYPLKFLGNNNSQPHVLHDYKLKEYKLDDKEKEILLILNKNADTKIIDIAKQTNLSAELILYKIKKLQQEKILITTRAYFDMEKIGYFYSLIFINFNNLSSYNQERLRKFAKNSKHVDTFMMMLGKPNCYMQIFHKEMSELHEILNNLQQEFKNELLSVEIVPLKNEGSDANILPFL